MAGKNAKMKKYQKFIYVRNYESYAIKNAKILKIHWKKLVYKINFKQMLTHFSIFS